MSWEVYDNKEISSRKRSIILGTILDDAHIAMLRTNARLEIGHSEKQKDYLLWKCQELQKFLPTVSSYVTFDKRYKKKYVQFRMRTRVHPVISKFHKLFYKNNRKIVPKNICVLLKNPLSLAVWFMDDGGRRNDSYGLFLNTLAFSQNDHELLQFCLKKNFSLDSRLHWVQDGFRMYIPSKHAKHFSELVYHYIHPTMLYKLSYNPVTTSFARLERARDRKV